MERRVTADSDCMSCPSLPGFVTITTRNTLRIHRARELVHAFTTIPGVWMSPRIKKSAEVHRAHRSHRRRRCLTLGCRKRCRDRRPGEQSGELER